MKKHKKRRAARRRACKRRQRFLHKGSVLRKFREGSEARIYEVLPLPRTRKRIPKNLLHKVFYSEWISGHYIMGGLLRWITKKAYDFEETKSSQHSSHLGFLDEAKQYQKDRERVPKVFRRIPQKEWHTITLLLVNHTVDVLRTAKRIGIPVPEVFRPVFVKGKKASYWILEVSDLRTPETIVIPGQALDAYQLYEETRKEYGGKVLISNLKEIKRTLKNDERLLNMEGIKLDSEHKKFSGHMIRINKKTGKAERFLVDATNLERYYKEKKKEGTPKKK